MQPLTEPDLGFDEPGAAPLWFYVLREADKQKDGQCLGEVGGTTVAETILGLLKERPVVLLQLNRIGSRHWAPHLALSVWPISCSLQLPSRLRGGSARMRGTRCNEGSNSQSPAAGTLL